MSGFGYHNGPVFAVYHPRRGKALKGGRYDGIGSQFGVERPATGFDLDLKQILREENPSDLIFAHFACDPAELSKRDLLIKKAKARWERVQVALSARRMSLTNVGRKYAALMAIGKLFRSNRLNEC